MVTALPHHHSAAALVGRLRASLCLGFLILPSGRHVVPANRAAKGLAVNPPSVGAAARHRRRIHHAHTPDTAAGTSSVIAPAAT